MASCLGLYIEEHLIKYAKVAKEHDSLKVEAFGVKFYDKIGDAIKQIVEETYSQKTPVSINLSEEIYNYFSMFALVTKSDLQKAVMTEFDSYCTDKGYNSNNFESKYVVGQDWIEKDKLRVIHISASKSQISKRIQQFSDCKLTNISPVSMSIPNLIKNSDSDGYLIVNMEEKTTVTTVINDKIDSVDILDDGSEQILNAINLKENSYSISYEICKNTTIYTSEGTELQEEELGYLEDIMPTLYKIVGKIKKLVNNNKDRITKVYLTGTIALINNVDLYFQEYLPEISCEILKPYFIDKTQDISIKDYLEVNSAISIAMMGLNIGISGMNFRKLSISEKMPLWMKMEVGTGKKQQINLKELFTWDLNQSLDKTEKGLIRIAAYLLILVIIYSGFSMLLNYQMDMKMDEAQELIDDTNKQIILAENDSDELQERINQYTNMVRNLEAANDRLTDESRTRNRIPNLLNQIMSVIPANAQLLSIKNTEDNHIVIEAQSDKYEQLGFFIARLKTEVILTDVVSSAGEKSGNIVKVKIEGDLP